MDDILRCENCGRKFQPTDQPYRVRIGKRGRVFAVCQTCLDLLPDKPDVRLLDATGLERMRLVSVSLGCSSVGPSRFLRETDFSPRGNPLFSVMAIVLPGYWNNFKGA
jgi:hypothetical protein